MACGDPGSDELKARDPLARQAESGAGGPDISPMDPPGAYEPPAEGAVPYEEMHAFLRRLVDEHVPFVKALNDFEETLVSIQKNGMSRKAEEGLRDFFVFFDHEFTPHNRREEAALFPALHRALVLKGEHSNGTVPTTAVDMMEDDHVKAVQLAAVVFNFFGLASRLPDPRSALMTLDAAVEQGKALAERLRLHIFREDRIVFPLAHLHLEPDELDRMMAPAPAA